MFFEKIETKGLAHFSYMIGDGSEIAVIDPRRDISIYMDKARKAGMKIKYILETHRNEDYIVGSIELAKKTGAKVYISGHENMGYTYGQQIKDGFELEIGDLLLKALHTPGHTLGHLSYVLYEKCISQAYMVFCGDCLFMGDVGRTDFYGKENLEKMTGLQYDSIFEKLLPLGDEVIILPAHGAGSACGDNLDKRPFSTLGYEKKTNKNLQVKSRSEFIEKFAKMRIKPRYFDVMEVLNVGSPDFVGSDIVLNAITISDLDKIKDKAVLVDVRSKEAFIGGHIPKSLYLSKSNLTSFLGSIYTPNNKLVFLMDAEIGDLEEIYWYCRRIGFDDIYGYVPNSIEMWQTAGKNVNQLNTISVKKFKTLPKDKDYILLDVRDSSEISSNDPKTNRLNIPLKSLYKNIDLIDKDKDIYVLCGTGNRSTTAASYLKIHGINATVISGGILMYHNS